jgi:AraC-like DNA-binding protein
LTRHDSDLGWWEIAKVCPEPAMRPYVREYVGYVESMAVAVSRREPPGDVAPVIINFGAPVHVYEAGTTERGSSYTSFCAGPYDTHVVVGSDGPFAGLQINFTIFGARLFFGRPLHELTNRVVDLETMFGAAGVRLLSELHDAGSWEARFAIVDREVAARIQAARRPPEAVTWAWRRLKNSHGQVSIGTLLDEIGCSQRHLIARFRDELGLTPKVFARVLRFGRALDAMQRDPSVRLADLAIDCGYFDQAHFSRDFREFAGISPTDLLKSVLPDQGGFAAGR